MKNQVKSMEHNNYIQHSLFNAQITCNMNSALKMRLDLDIYPHSHFFLILSLYFISTTLHARVGKLPLAQHFNFPK